MKYCAKCGSGCEDKVQFCVKCGTKFEALQASANEASPEVPPQIIQGQPQFQQFQPPPQPQYIPPPSYGGYMPPPPPPVTPATGILKQVSSSPLFLVFVLLYSVLQVVALIRIFTSNSAGTLVDVPAMFIGILAWSLPALIGLGLWMHYAAASDKSTGGMKTSGLSIIKVCAVITLVLLCLALLLVFFGFAILLVASLSTGVDSAVASMAAMFGVYLLFAVLYVVYYVKVLSSVGAVSTCAATGQPRKVSAYVAVFNLVGALGHILWVIVSSWVATFVYSWLEQALRQLVGNMYGFDINTMMAGVGGAYVLSIVGSVLNALVLVLISVAMFSYNSKIGALSYPRTYPQYPPQNQYPSGF